MRIIPSLSFYALLFLAAAPLLPAAEPPRSVADLWADFDPRKDPLETEIIREWQEDGLVLRNVRFLVGTFKGKPARIAAFYAFPQAAKEKLPAVMHIHGGGQRASLDEVKLLALRGYAALSVNWGGREMEQARPGDLNTDWGAVDPTQQNVPGYTSMLPGPKQFFEDHEDPRNCNWYLLALGCRRGLTFLEQQPQVDAQRLGIHGYSMGGNLTMYVAGTDARVKAAVPGVGGQGWRWEPHHFIGGDARQEIIKGDVEVFRRTLSFESYAPLIRCPLLHRSATNDFHGWMDDVYRTDALIQGQPVQHAWSPHFNHRLSPEVAIAMPLWLDQFLKGGPALPAPPASELSLKTPDGIASLNVRPQSAWPVARCEIFYSVDTDPRARFWRSADVTRAGGSFTAKLPLQTFDAPLAAFANVYYTLPKPESMKPIPGYPKSITEVCLSTGMHHASPEQLQSSPLRPQPIDGHLLDDFSHGWRDWYTLNGDHKPLWQHWTRKVTDPTFRGPDDAALALTLTMAEANEITVVLIENEWRSYRGPKRSYACTRQIPGGAEAQTITFALADFKDEQGRTPANWSQLDQLGLCAHYDQTPAGKAPAPISPWRGELPTFRRLEWRTPAPAKAK